jgi:putative SOS response-associated peptidase YedK
VCGRYTNTAGVEELNDRFKVPIVSEAGTHRFNIAPTEEVLAIVAAKGEPHARLLRWGLVPPWAHELGGTHKMINARMETVATSPAYRNLIPKASRRALQLAEARAPRRPVAAGAAPAVLLPGRRRRPVRVRGGVDAHQDCRRVDRERGAVDV